MELAVVTATDAENPDLGDMLLVSGDAVLLEDLAQETAQRLHVALRFSRGEWFLDLREGVPYFDEIFVKNPQDKVIRAVFSSVILQTEGIATLERLDYTIDSRTRVMQLDFAARLTDGTVFLSSDFGPFLVGVGL